MTKAEDTLEQRLVEMESKIAYQEDLLQSLNDIVAKQNAELASLEKRFQKLAQLLKNNIQESHFSDKAEDNIPPHY